MNSGSFNPRDYRKFSGVVDYKEEIERHGYKVPLQFFIAVSNIMKKKKISFGEACELLEDNEYLIWDGSDIRPLRSRSSEPTNSQFSKRKQYRSNNA